QTCWAHRLEVYVPMQSQISSETRERDTLDERIRRAGQGKRNRVGHVRSAYHFFTRPFAVDLIPDFGSRRGRVNIDHANFSVPQFLAHALRKSFKSELAHAIRAPVGKCPSGCNGENIHDARCRWHSRSAMLRE